MAKLHVEYLKNKEAKISVMDQAICRYIEEKECDYYDTHIMEDCHFQVWYQLSVLRCGLLNWYDFKEGADVLEIGAGFGALTGLLCDKCTHVTATERSEFRAEAIVKRWQKKGNLDVYAGEWTEMNFERKFDYIILTGILERCCDGTFDTGSYIKYLQEVSKLLKPEGILLVAVENRYGLKYFCGAKEPHTGKAFDGINRYPAKTKGYSFSRQELQEIITRSGFWESKFYYPLPDYKLPQLIYTDEYLPEKNLRERLIPYYLDKGTLLALEKDLYEDVIQNGVFPFFANSFFVECSNFSKTGDVVYAAVSTDRGRDRSFSTVIYRNQQVRKKSLFPEGKAAVDALCTHLSDLRGHGIPVIPFECQEDNVTMPYIKSGTLSDYLKVLIKEDKDEFIKILDCLYDYILRSSEEVSSEENRLVGKVLAKAESIEETEKIKELDWGPVLKKAYMELIPLNCFYKPEEKEFLFFDQEFVRDYYPAKYVLFRAIHYIYCFATDAESYLPRRELMERYGLSDLWTYFWREEQEFLDEVRNHKLYGQFYRWAKVDKQVVYSNVKKLQSEEEKIAEYRISDKMKKIWNVELQMLDLVDVICKKNNISYFIVQGSLLGAARHKGFIPWDDDLDVGMKRKDYDRFLEVAAKELQEPFELQNMWSQEDYFFGGFTRIRNANTTGIQANDLERKCNLGIWIDILPYDNCVEDENKLALKLKKLKKAHLILRAKVDGKGIKKWGDVSKATWIWYKVLAKLYPHKYLCKQIDDAMRLYTEEKTEYLSTFTGYGNPRMLPKKDFEETTLLDFAGRKVPVPIGYQNYLFMIWGKDYMKYPPEEERKPKHRGIFDPDRPYGEYLQKLTGMFDNVKGKKIILWGSGKMFEDYMQKWGSKYRPDFLVDNDKDKWDKKRMGIEIKSPQTILEIPQEKRHLIICSFYYKEIQKQLEEMGVYDYQIYVQHLEWILKAEEQR